MTEQAHIESLERKHDLLEKELVTALSQPASDDQVVADIKRRKLKIKDELARMKATSRR